MVRSKFPGKPSKIVNRKVVKSNKFCVVHDNESSKAAENISYGLSVFNETFGDHEQDATAFHGFSPHEVEKAREAADNQQVKVEEEYRCSGLDFPPEKGCLVKIDPPTSQMLSYVEANLSLIGPVGWRTPRAQCQNLHSRNVDLELPNTTCPTKVLSAQESNLKNHVANRLLQRAKKTNLDVSPASRVLLSSQLDRKFVLPSRSMRSSRVIKPNKRFLESGDTEEDPLPNPLSPSTQSCVIELKKPRLILDRICDFTMPRSAEGKVVSAGVKFINASSATFADDNNKEHVKLGELNVFGAPTTRPKRRSSQSSSSEGSPKKDGSTYPSTSTQLPSASHLSEAVSPSRSKLILRESKLNISPAAGKQKEGLFSVKPKKGLNVKVIKSPGTSTDCAVCGAARFHRLTKQSLKFGLVCCDPCRKFITKMVLRARSSENSVPCENGQGNCAVSSPLKGESFATKVNRCGACWLLLCVQRLDKMPEKVRDGLVRMLPANMQGMTVVLPSVTIASAVPIGRNRRRKVPRATTRDSSSSPKHSLKNSSVGEQASLNTGRKLSTPSSSKRMTQTPIARIKRKAALVSLANNLKRVRDKTSVVPKLSLKKSPNSGEVKKICLSKKSDVSVKNLEKCGRKGTNKLLEKNKDGQTRQKLNLKGPRVKHVCRSASIVLGQPLATFPVKSPASPKMDEAAADVVDSPETLEKVPRSKHDCGSRENKLTVEALKAATSEEEKEPGIKSTSASLFVVPAVNSQSSSKVISKYVPDPRVAQTAAPGRKMTKLLNIPNPNKLIKRGQRRTLQDLGVFSTPNANLPELISLDFWESYDPDEVCNTGFGLIGFDPFEFKPVCFLCGSAGKKKLLHCASCCEPYHQFCVEMGVLGGLNPESTQSTQDDWRVDWVCPRCTVCHGCGHNSGHQLTVCQRCHHSFHLECLGTSAVRKSAGDRLWICSSCLRCKSCNSSDVTKFVGNLPFCKVCFKLRQKGNFCPLCQGCYMDDDYQSKMMECAECNSWVHATCEGLSDEKYQVLSYLPESVEFICRRCCPFPPAPWWAAVEAELQAGYNNIIKAITKNRKAYTMLKWSPQKACDCQHHGHVPTPKVSDSVLSLGKRRLSFNINAEGGHGNALPDRSKPPKDCEMAGGIVSSIFEFDDDIDAGENIPITRFTHAKEKSKHECKQQDYSNLLVDCGNDSVGKTLKAVQFSPNAGSQSDSGVGSTDDELKTSSATEEDDVDENKTLTDLRHECACTSHISRHPFATLLSIKKKVNSNKYSSIIEFHQEMDQTISEADSQEVKELYYQTLLEVFPWFDPQYERIARTSFPMSPCKPHQGSLLQFQSSNTSPEKLNHSPPSSCQILERLLPKSSNLLEDEYFYYGQHCVDTRICGFCKLMGDSDSTAEGRLLYCGQNEWVHVNCALWSAEVFEEIDGALQNVSNALSRGRMIKCTYCGKKGASVGCCAKKCEETLHFPCARVSGFVFMEDKNVFCSLHTKDAPGKPLIKSSDFDVCRPVFVELDRRKKRSIESKHVRLMIGSLHVQNLGSVIPAMSDQGSCIVPTQFCCTRLFWSSKEPWRIVRYTIKTTVRMPTPEPILDPVQHITVDHSKENCGIDSKLMSSMDNSDKEALTNINVHLKSVPCTHKASEDIGTNAKHQVKSDIKIVQSVMSHILDTVCCKEVDEEVTDAQSSADLLPPELKDAIFDDLPHDLLDGISMQDIFQDKFPSYEESCKDETQEETNAGSSKCDSEKMRMSKIPCELKRSQSDVLPSNSAHVDSRLHQRSCSLAWSYKLGTSISCCKAPKATAETVLDRTKLIQELRLSVKPAPSMDLQYHLSGPVDKGKENQTLSWSRIMQVDGTLDSMSSASDEFSDDDAFGVGCCKSLKEHVDPPMKFTSKLAEDSELLCNRIECLKTITSAALSQNPVVLGGNESHNQHLKKKNCRKLTKKSSWKREASGSQRNSYISQLDGTNDISSDSEQEGASEKSSQEQSVEKPVRCSRCGCTYRTEESYARHLPSCSGDYSLTTSESETEISEDDVESTTKSVSAPSPDSAISVSSGSHCAASFLPASVSPRALPPISTSNSTVFSVASKSQGPPIKSKADPVFTSASSNVHLLPKPPNPGPAKVIATVSKVQRAPKNKPKAIKMSFQQHPSKLAVREIQSTLQHHQLFGLNNHQQNSHQAIQHSISTSTLQQPQQPSQMITMLDYHQSQQSGPTVLVQSVPSQAMVPAYLEAFQQHTGQNLQYLTTVDTNSSFGKTQYLTAVPTVLPGAYQLQAISDGQLCLEPSSVGLSTISGLQLAQAQLAPASMAQSQPQVLGTLLPSALPCNVVTTTEPIYETIQMFPDQSGGVLLASQPMLTCMETVVSNTFMSMSSSQFVSSSVPGMMQGSSSYSTTTTQVFQASKVDPPVLDVPTQYVVVNTHPTLSDATVGNLEVMSISPSQIQEQASIQTQAQIQVPSINLPVPVTLTAPVPPQTLPPVIPTSAVTPTPRIQPQRTYSKPSKNMKDSIVSVVKKPFSQNNAAKEDVKALSQQVLQKCTVEIVPTNDSSTILLHELKPTTVFPESAPKNPTTSLSDHDVKNSLSSSVPSVAPSELITTITAPAGSITLPDPVKANVPSTNGPKVVPVPITTASIKSPPVTFSYRAHAVEKSKPKQNANVDAVPATAPTTSKWKIDLQNIKIQPGKMLNGHSNPSLVHPHVVASQPVVVSPSATGISMLCAQMKVDRTSNESSSMNKKPTAAITPQTQTVKLPALNKLASTQTSGSIVSSSITLPGNSSAEVNPLKSQLTATGVPALSVSTSQPSISTSSTVSSSNSLMSNSSSPSQVGKNVSLSLMTASITDSLTSTATSLTSSMNSSKPVPSTRLQGSSTVVQPLKEVNNSNLNPAAKSIPLKVQETDTSVHSAVLKSTSQNVHDPLRRSAGFRAQGEVPAIFQNGDGCPSSLKLLFQKQAHSGCYKVSSSPGKKESELVAVKLADINIVTSVIKDRKGGKDESENVEPVEKTPKKTQAGSSAPEILYEINCQDGFSYSSTSISDAWQKVFGAVQEARASHKMPPLLHNPFHTLESGHNVMGLGNNSLKYLLEQLPGAGDCSKYRPVYHKSRLPGSGYQFKREDQDVVSTESRSGCARTDPYLSAKKYDMFSWLDSRHRRPPKLLDNTDLESLTGSRRAASTSLPMAMRFRHLRETSKTSVGVFRSDIQGRGLFCLRDIEAGEMVIEYAGEVIRNTLTDNRERYYQSKGIGCYMFKVDENFTVDATQKGNAARFINHSCEPNCYSRVVDILGKKHIIIFALRRIPQGEELTYDYKFPIEDEKIHCHCLSRRCRKYLN